MSFTVKMPLEEAPWARSGIHAPMDVANYIADFRNRGERVTRLLSEADSRTADPFIEGAQQALEPFSIASRSHKVTSRSNCRASEMKDGDKPTTIFLIADANAMAAQSKLIAFAQWSILQELKRHPNKHVTVHLLADEVSNFKLNELGSLMTWARGYGIRMHLFLQNFSGFIETYGQHTFDTLTSEAEIQQFLPQTRQPAVIRYILERLGLKSVMVKRKRGSHGKGGGISIDGTDYSEEGREVMTFDEIRRSKEAITFIRNNKAAKTTVPPISAIAPWRKKVAIDPHHGKKWLLPIVLRIPKRFLR